MMNLQSSVRPLLGAFVLAGVTACAANEVGAPPGPRLRPAVDVPDHFLSQTSAGAVEPGKGEGCWNPIVDARNGTLLTLFRSAEGQGDYQPKPLRYGVKSGELLRVDCATGRALGIVKR